MKKYFSLSLFLFMVLLVTGQNVGIGTISPTEKLQVEGNILTDTVKLNAMLLAPNAGAGKILTSDNNGNASWAEMSVPTESSNNGNVGYGVWGDCATNGNISEYFPVADTAGIAGDQFGTSVSISGDFAIVGSPFDKEAITNQGSASIYHFNGSGWDFIQKLTDPNGANGDHFGISVSISGNFVVVGSDSDDEAFVGQGSATLFQFNGTTWDWLEKITDPDAAPSDQFGFSVSLDGNELMVSSYRDNINAHADQGSVCVFQFDGSQWMFAEKILDTSGEAGDEFGYNVKMSNGYAIIGSILDDMGTADQGSASIYQFNGSTWDFMQKISDSGGALNDFFGASVSISFPYAVVGAYGDDVGSNGNQGSVSIYRYNGTNWVSVQKRVNLTGAPNDFFGFSVYINGNDLMVGADGDDVATNAEQGSLTFYQRVGYGWQQMQFLSEPGGNAADFFGISCMFDSTSHRFIIGASAYLSNTGKVVFGKIN